MREETLEILFHMLGLRPSMGKLNAYRNHYVAGPGHHAEAKLGELVAARLVGVCQPPGFLGAEDVLYAATDEGRAVAMKAARERAPKLTRSQRRYRRWLASDFECTFGDWIKGGYSDA